jgi:hypothetical protein
MATSPEQRMSGPFSFDRGTRFEFEVELAKEINRPSQVVDDDPDVVHPFQRHVFSVQVSAHDHAAGRIGDATIEVS